jgi:hypothetical protein
VKDDIRPKGTVEVRCSYPGCGWCWWVSPLDPRLPDGPWDCGSDHEASKVVFHALSLLKLRHGLVWGSVRGLGAEMPPVPVPSLPVPSEPSGETAKCACAPRSYSAGQAVLHSRTHDRTGVLEWASLDDLRDADALPAKMNWDPAKLAEFEGAGGPTLSGPPSAAPGMVRWVGYHLNGRIKRKYVFVKCARPGCALYVTVDLADPDFKLGPNDWYSVGPEDGHGEAPKPYWWDSWEFRCEKGLSSHEPQPCALIHSDVTREFEAVTGTRWTMWTPQAVLFFDSTKDLYGVIVCKPEYFQSADVLRREILWGELGKVAHYLGVMVPKETHDDVRNEVLTAIQPDGV